MVFCIFGTQNGGHFGPKNLIIFWEPGFWVKNRVPKRVQKQEKPDFSRFFPRHSPYLFFLIKKIFSGIIESSILTILDLRLRSIKFWPKRGVFWPPFLGYPDFTLKKIAAMPCYFLIKMTHFSGKNREKPGFWPKTRFFTFF